MVVPGSGQVGGSWGRREEKEEKEEKEVKEEEEVEEEGKRYKATCPR